MMGCISDGTFNELLNKQAEQRNTCKLVQMMEVIEPLCILFSVLSLLVAHKISASKPHGMEVSERGRDTA